MADPPAPKSADLGIPIHDVLSRISEGFVVVDNDWRFTYVNVAAERIWGIRSADVIGRTPQEALGVDPDNPFNATYQQSKASGEPTALSAFSALFGGWLEVRGIPHVDGYAILFRDVTSQRQVHLDSLERERALVTASTINQGILDSSLDLIYVTDGQGNLVRVSPSAQAILGYEPAEMEGRTAIHFIHPDDLELTRTQMRRARRTSEATAFDCRYLHKDGHVVPLSWKGRWSPTAKLHFFIGRDLTDRIAAEERLRHAQRLEAVGQLTGGIAHDFNNLLSVVMGNLDLILARPEIGARPKRFAQAALHAARRGAELTRGLLAFSRQQPLNPATINPNALVGNWVRLLSRTVGEHIEVVFRPGADVWPVHIDPANLETAVANLAVNARDAMPKGGQLLIETQNATLDEDYVRVNPEAVPGDYVAVVVSDTGTGMPSEVLNRIFEPFFTTKEAGRGTGLGLSMVFGFVKQSGGHIKAYSEVGHGTTVRLYLPRASAAPAAARKAAGTA